METSLYALEANRLDIKAANHRAEEERAARYAPQMSQTASPPTMAMSLERAVVTDSKG